MSMTKEELENIKKRFAHIIAYSQGYNPKDMNVDAIFDAWLDAKRDFIEAFNGEPIIEYPKPVEFPLSPQEKVKRFESALDTIKSLTYYDYHSMYAFIAEQGVEGFYSNTVLCEYPSTKITVGMRLLKALRYFISSPELLNKVQQYISSVIQEDKMTGILCFSVHPLDFLTLSENHSNWRSCHALDGEYRAGNLSYMVDKSTFICYVRSTAKASTPNLPDSEVWNNKKWRMLIYMSDNWDFMVAGRQYPLHLDSALSFIQERAFPAINFPNFSPWCDKYITSFLGEKGPFFNIKGRYLPINGTLVTLEDIVTDVIKDTPLHYNDVLYSTVSSYHPSYCFRARTIELYFDESYQVPNVQDFPKINVGAPVPCPMCGEGSVTMTEAMICNHCLDKYGPPEGYSECYECGTYVYVDDGEIVEGEFVCESCFESMCAPCARCDEQFFDWNLKDIELPSGDIAYCLCPYCAEDTLSAIASEALSVDDF